MYTELATVKDTIDLTPQSALDRARSFLTRQGYTSVKRTDYSLTAERRPPGDDVVEQNVPHLKVIAFPQPHGGVRLKVRGNDQEEVRVHQAVWTEWSEGLPKKTEARSDEAGAQGALEIADIPQEPPPMVGTSPWLDDSAKAWVVRGMGLSLGALLLWAMMFFILPVLLFVAGVDLLGSAAEFVDAVSRQITAQQL